MKKPSWLVLGLLLLPLGCSRDPPNRPPGVAPPRTVFPLHHESPSWSVGLLAYRDNGIVCVRSSGFYTIDGSKAGIWTYDPATGNRRRLWPDGRIPAWSPDGTQLALSYQRQLALLDSSGVNLRVLTGSGGNFSPAWSPDGSQLAWNRTLVDPGVYVVNADGTNPRLLVPWGRDPDWHPSLPRLLYVAAPESSGVLVRGIYELDLSSGQSRLLWRVGYDARTPRYSPDGSRIAVANHPSNERFFSIWLLEPDGSGAVHLSGTPAEGPAWTKDGSRITFTRAHWTQDLPGNGVLWSVTVPAARETLLLSRWPESCP